MMELNWGKPLTYVVSRDGDTKKFTTIEQARYWLHARWPVANQHRDQAIAQVDAAMDCLTPVDAARLAFIRAARSAGFRPADGETGQAMTA